MIRTLRSTVATLVWWSSAAVSVCMAVAVLGRALRADAAAQPWEFFFVLADRITPAALEDVLGQQTGVAGVGLDMAVWSAGAGFVLLAALLITWVVRPRQSPQSEGTDPTFG